MVRVGYALGYGKFTNAKEMADVMRQAEERGFEMAFFSETIELMRDSVSSLAAIGLATKNLRLGSTQIVRLRGPVMMAQSLATLDELTGRRASARRRDWRRRRTQCRVLAGIYRQRP